ncbi:hypothetical protein GSbR_14070 [Geobacter sp. SVR]|nr:hypothetical protein GSVR_43520 [Geobacter sp. SVR]GCF84807.1 hypothetical protein GSbR_14070 [Geobacter sp. SVR]
MPSSRPDKTVPEGGCQATESSDFRQLGLDFRPSDGYSQAPRKEDRGMNQELFERLDSRITELVEKYASLKEENARLAEENQRLLSEREGLTARVDAILGKLEGL